MDASVLVGFSRSTFLKVPIHALLWAVLGALTPECRSLSLRPQKALMVGKHVI